MVNSLRLSCSLGRHRGIQAAHGRRYFNHAVYRVPTTTRMLETIISQIPAFASATNEFTHPTVMKADITDITREGWLSISNRGRENLPTKLRENPYVPPAIIKWFKGTPKGSRIPVRFSSWFEKKAARSPSQFPMELIRPARHAKWKSAKRQQLPDNPTTQPETFELQQLPLNALTQAFSSGWSPPFSIYLAQVPLNDMPLELFADLPLPYLISGVVPTDIYSSSLWLGSEPTYTSLHRDPNPNYFTQLCGRKHIRLLKPSFGAAIYDEVNRSIGGQGNRFIRGIEMMEGPEKDALEAAIWGDWFTGSSKTAQPSETVLDVNTIPMKSVRVMMTEDIIWEAIVDPGDVLYIPLGWWHSVRSSHDDGRLNGSANWWFRYADRERNEFNSSSRPVPQGIRRIRNLIKPGGRPLNLRY